MPIDPPRKLIVIRAASETLLLRLFAFFLSWNIIIKENKFNNNK